MSELNDIGFIPAAESDYEEFKALQLSVMSEHVKLMNPPLDEWGKDDYHREVFNKKGLRVILYQSRRVGFIGVREESPNTIIDRFCIAKEHQRKMIGTRVMQKIIRESFCRDKNIKLCVLRKNPAINLYIRLGFVVILENEMLINLQRPPQQAEHNLRVETQRI